MLVVLAVSGQTGVTGRDASLQPGADTAKMGWFGDAKLGIFIHYGIYAVNGIDESWSFHNKKVTWPAYMAQLKGFTASKYDPEKWAELIKSSGARYAVITTKHHDGVALWPTAQKHYDVVRNTPAKRDLLTPFFKALEKNGIRKGAYFSLIDWSYPDYPGFLKDSSRYKLADDPNRWKRFSNFNQAQIKEISDRFNPDLFWFDGDWEHSADEWDAAGIRKNILTRNSQAIINSRLQGYGDYETPEQNTPVVRPKGKWWELCMTINDNWGFQPQDQNWKTPAEIISIFADAISSGGNLLLDIGPREDGTIPDQEVAVLKALGEWSGKHSEAIFGTVGGLQPGHYYGPSTYSKDSSTLYLFLAGKPNGNIMIKGLKNAVKKVRVVGTAQTLPHKVVGKISWSPVPGLVFISVPETVKDTYMSVLALELDGPISLYGGKGGL
ncbi:putative glycosidase [Flavihumibacter petaseus NBRC 106054]|uniref:alpha-L-fucosidase n=1 Tax=Flavihumibacter petaseus NBRC 106054 TaxID=1220578 RepID=A0A0E9N6Y1_9BACT|nr:putative glycosidase [Flavihumibacter petaseus NBRC 106054]